MLPKLPPSRSKGFFNMRAFAISLSALALATGSAAILAEAPALAADAGKIAIGGKAPMFTTTGAKAGKA